MKTFFILFLTLIPTLAFGLESHHFSPHAAAPMMATSVQECADTAHYHLCGGPLATAMPTAAPTPPPTAIPTVGPTPSPVCISITSPVNNATVSGASVPIVTSDTCSGVWFETLYLDGVSIGSFVTGQVILDTTKYSNGLHAVRVDSNSQNPGSVVLGSATVNVNISNVAPTPGPTPPVTGLIPQCKDATSCAQFPLTDAQAKAYTDQYFANQPFSQEKITQNISPNNHNAMVPTAAQLTAVTPLTNLQNSDGQRLMKLVSGNCYPGGTTQQIYTCAAIKWGYPPRMYWAEGYNESYWSHGSIGDIGNGVSLGILQVKSSDFTGTCPGVTGCPSHNYTADSDANNYALCPNLNAKGTNGYTCLTYQYTNYGAEYAIAWQHACMVGDNTYLSSGTGGKDSVGFTFPPYRVGPGQYNDKWGCMGTWYSGQWLFGPGSTEYAFNNNMGYHVFMQHYYCCQPYNYSGFGNGQSGTGLSCNAACQLP